MKVESRAAYAKGQAAKSEYKAADGKAVKLDSKDVKIDSLRKELDQQKWVNRQQRQEQTYGRYYSQPVVVQYHDPYPSFFWLWLLDRSLDERAAWAYHHRGDMDAQRYKDLLAKDAKLEARIKELEKQQVKVDPAYTPKGLDADMMYSNEYVDAVYNPTKAADTEEASSGDVPIGWICFFIFVAFVVIMVLAAVLGGE